MSHRATAFTLAVIVLVSTTPLAGQRNATFRDPHSQEAFRAGRQLLGGEAPIEALRAFVMRGAARTEDEGGVLVERAVEIRVLLPDQYLRIETAAGFERRTGFAGRDLLSEIRRGPTTERPAANLTASLLRSERFRLARLLLGSLLATSNDLWLTFRWTPRYGEMSREVMGTIVSVDTGAPPTLEVLGKDFFSRLLLTSRRVPMRVDYVAGERDAASMTFGDRRRVEGLLWPHRITTARNGVTIDDLVLDEIVVNPPLAKGDFSR